ncbi:MAG: hypothetical protein JWQ84_3354 [Mucilaginibacter sp.]|jgi:hypothetical protein|nr:hypothetical protein [Mucilaginibacter sp.]MDB5018522.1 hypothetical protein [Mucilaginibacter sp.]
MALKYKDKILAGFFLCAFCGWLLTNLTSCGKASTASPTGLNIRYEVLNLSPDLFPVNLFIRFTQVNTVGNPFVFAVPHGYFYVPYVDTPYQYRSNSVAGLTLFSRDDVVKSGLTYSLFIVGARSDNSLTQLFTVDTASEPALGRGKVRFINVSPTGVSGLNVSANGTPAFSNIVYLKYSKYLELPIGNYDFKINSTGSSAILKDLPGVTIQDGRLYTIYAYGYTTRSDSAAFNAGVITNK